MSCTDFRFNYYFINYNYCTKRIISREIIIIIITIILFFRRLLKKLRGRKNHVKYCREKYKRNENELFMYIYMCVCDVINHVFGKHSVNRSTKKKKNKKRKSHQQHPRTLIITRINVCSYIII